MRADFSLSAALRQGSSNADVIAIAQLCFSLKASGRELNEDWKELVDSLVEIIRLICRKNDLDDEARLRALKVLELRALEWVSNEVVEDYYRKKLSQIANSVVMANSLAIDPLPSTLQSSSSSVEFGRDGHAAKNTASQSASAGNSWRSDEDGDDLVIGGKTFAERMAFFGQRYDELVGDIDPSVLYWEPKPSFKPKFAPRKKDRSDWEPPPPPQGAEGQFEDAD